MSQDLVTITATSISGNRCEIRISKSATGKDLKRCIENAANSAEVKASILELYNGNEKISNTDALGLEDGAEINYTVSAASTVTFRLPVNAKVDEAETIKVLIPISATKFEDLIHAASLYVDWEPAIAENSKTCEPSARIGRLNSPHEYSIFNKDEVPFFFNGQYRTVGKNVKFGQLLQELVPENSDNLILAIEKTKTKLAKEQTIGSTPEFLPWSEVTAVKASSCLLL